jgi:endoglycosylceramidase
MFSMSYFQGIYVLIEMHQDALSERFCGEGAPLWAIDISSPLDRVGVPLPNSTVGFPRPMAPPYELDNNGVPSPEDCDKYWWSNYQLTIAAANAYQNIYDNVGGLADAFANYWKVVAKTLGHHPNIFGYEIMNEPFAGQVFDNPSLLLPGVADRLNLQKLYDKVSDAIREVDTKNLILYEGVTWDNFVTGFTHAPGK